ncbi:MAG: copper chaperone PCu(A)C [Bordetella sp.]|uniref:copper chaperone PCu(A)C n=1 Tax=Bordetella sp. TaxID=28081 RepID=UPI003F7C62CF
MKEAIMLASLLVLAPLVHAQGMAGMSMGGAKSGMATGHGTTAMAPKNISVQDCWIRLLPGAAPSAGYFTIENSGDQPVSLTGAHTDAFGMAMLHETHKDSKGVMGMSAVHDVPVPAKGRLAFAPGGYHVMLEKPARPLHIGDKVALTLAFGGDRALTTQCEARSPAGTVK